MRAGLEPPATSPRSPKDWGAWSRFLVVRRVLHPLEGETPGDSRHLPRLELVEQAAETIRRAFVEIRVVHILQLRPELDLRLAIQAVLLFGGRCALCRSRHRSSRPSRLFVVIHGMSSGACRAGLSLNLPRPKRQIRSIVFQRLKAGGGSAARN